MAVSVGPYSFTQLLNLSDDAIDALAAQYTDPDSQVILAIAFSNAQRACSKAMLEGGEKRTRDGKPVRTWLQAAQQNAVPIVSIAIFAVLFGYLQPMAAGALYPAGGSALCTAGGSCISAAGGGSAASGAAAAVVRAASATAQPVLTLDILQSIANLRPSQLLETGALEHLARVDQSCRAVSAACMEHGSTAGPFYDATAGRLHALPATCLGALKSLTQAVDTGIVSREELVKLSARVCEQVERARQYSADPLAHAQTAMASGIVRGAARGMHIAATSAEAAATLIAPGPAAAAAIEAGAPTVFSAVWALGTAVCGAALQYFPTLFGRSVSGAPPGAAAPRIEDGADVEAGPDEPSEQGRAKRRQVIPPAAPSAAEAKKFTFPMPAMMPAAPVPPAAPIAQASGTFQMGKPSQKPSAKAQRKGSKSPARPSLPPLSRPSRGAGGGAGSLEGGLWEGGSREAILKQFFSQSIEGGQQGHTYQCGGKELVVAIALAIPIYMRIAYGSWNAALNKEHLSSALAGAQFTASEARHEIMRNYVMPFLRSETGNRLAITADSTLRALESYFTAMVAQITTTAFWSQVPTGTSEFWTRKFTFTPSTMGSVLGIGLFSGAYWKSLVDVLKAVYGNFTGFLWWVLTSFVHPLRLIWDSVCGVVKDIVSGTWTEVKAVMMGNKVGKAINLSVVQHGLPEPKLPKEVATLIEDKASPRRRRSPKKKSSEPLEAHTVAELKDMLYAKGLAVSGKKSVLIERLKLGK